MATGAIALDSDPCLIQNKFTQNVMQNNTEKHNTRKKISSIAQPLFRKCELFGLYRC